jgi:hypothetical protein
VGNTALSASARVATPVWSWNAIALLLVIVALGAAMRVYVFRGYVGLDDAEYSRIAYQMGYGGGSLTTYAGPPVFPLRVGLTVPTAIIYRAFGLSEWAMVAYPLALSVLSLVLVYACAGILFGPRAGLIAATLLSVFPWDLDCATKLLPDLPGAFFAAVGVTAIVALEAADIRRQSLLFVGGVAAGLAFGISWLCKESVTYLAPLCAVLMVMDARRDWSRTVPLWSGVALASVSILVGEVVVYRMLTGDVLFRFHEVERNYQENRKFFFSEGNPFGWVAGQTYAQAIIHRLFISGPKSFFADSTLLYLPLVGLMGSVHGWLRRDRSFLIPSIWLWTVVLMFNFSSSSTASYVPLALYQRYLYPIFFPAIVLVSGYLARTVFSAEIFRLGGNLASRVVGAAMAATIAWTAVPQLYYTLRYRQTAWTADVREVSRKIAPDAVVYADTLTLRALEFFRGYPPERTWIDFEDMSAGEVAPGALVMVNDQYIQWLERHGGIWSSRTSGYASHPFYHTPHPSWTAIYRNDNLVVYRVDRAATH